MTVSLTQCLRLAAFCKKDPSLKLNHMQHGILKDLKFHACELIMLIEFSDCNDYTNRLNKDLAKVKEAIKMYESK